MQMYYSYAGLLEVAIVKVSYSRYGMSCSTQQQLTSPIKILLWFLGYMYIA